MSERSSPGTEAGGKGSDGLADRGWVEVQKKTFTNWINDKLKETDYQVEELKDDLKDGVSLITLLQVLAPGKKMPGRFKKKPKMDIHKRENLDIAFRFISNVEKVPLVNIGVSDIYQGNLKLILGLIWALILRYQIAAAPPSSSNDDAESKEAQKKRVNAKKVLLNWVNASIPSQGVNNFSGDWNNGVSLSALVDYCKPGLIPDHASLNPDNRLENITNAMDLAEKELGVPKLMHPNDLAVDKPDDLSVMTYVSGFCRPGQQSLLDWVNSKIPNQPVSNLTTDWADGKALGALVDSLTQGGFPEYEQMKDDRFSNCQEGIDAAERLLGIPKTTTPENFMESDMDQLTRSTYITQLRHAKPSQASVASTLKAVGPGITGASAERETTFVVRGPRITKWAKLEVTTKAPDGSEVPLKREDTSSKASQFQYTPEVPGDYVVDVTFNSEPIPGSPFTVTHVPPTNVDGCVANGSGLKKARVGDTAGFSVNCEEGGPGELQVDIESPNGNVASEIEEPTQKNYSVNFTPAEIGDHMISVLWDNKDIPSSPFSCVVTDPKKCSVTGPGLGHQSFRGQPETITVKTDGAGPGELTVEVDGPSGSIPADIKDKGGSVFDITYIPKETGPHKVNIKWADDPIPGSPVSVDVLEPANASKCKVSDLPKGNLRVNNEYSFGVDTSNAGTGKLSASANGPTAPGSCNVKDSGNGLYGVDFSPAEVGVLKVDVSYGDESIPESPFEFSVNDPTKVKVDKDAIESGLHYVKEPVEFVVSAEDAGEGDVAASVQNPSGKEEEVSVKDKGNKAYLLSYSPEKGGSHDINITFDGCDIPNVPIKVLVDDSSRADSVVVSQPSPGENGAYVIKTPYDYKVDTENAGENELTATSVGTKTGLSPPVKVTKDGNGRYSASITADQPDEYTVAIQWGGDDIPGSPFKINIEDKPRPEKVVCSGLEYKVGSSDRVTLQMDATSAGAGRPSAICRGEKVKDVPVEIVEQEPKKYLVSFIPPDADIYSLDVQWESSSVTDSPFVVNLIPPDASKCIIGGPEVPLKHKEPIVVYVDASNAGNGTIAASAIGIKTGEKNVEIKETEPNKFVVSFIPNVTDVYDLDVTWGNSSVPGAPFRVSNSAANADKVMICEPPTAMLEAGQAIGICFDTSKGGEGVLTAICKGNSIGEIPIKVSQRPNAKDKYDVIFLPPEPDVFVVNVLWTGLDVKGSPFTINLMPVDVSKIIVIGPNMHHGPTGPVELMLQTAGAGKGKVTGTCVGNKAGQVEVVIKETSTDIYELCFIPPEPDTYSFNVQYGGQSLKGSPFQINTLPADASLVKVREPDSVDVSKLLTYKVDTSNAGSGKLNSLCRGEKQGQIQLDTVSEMEGHHNVSFTPNQADLYKVSMEWDGNEVPGSPFKVDLRPPMAERVKVGELHIPDEAGPGNYVWLDLDCSNAGHGPLKGEAKGKVLGKLPIEADRISRANYRMKFPTKQPDSFTFAVAYGDNQVIGSPFKINLVPPQADKVVHTRTTLPELEGGPVAMYFDTTDAGNGEMTANISNELIDTVTKKVEKVSFTEHKVTFIPDAPDIYDVDIKWSGNQINGSPFKVDTRPPFHPELIECGNPVYSDINLPVDVLLDTSRAGPGKVTAKCYNSDGTELPVDIKRPTSRNEKYDISFIPKVHGTYNLSVFFEDNEIKNSPLTVDLNPISETMDMVVLQSVEESFNIPEDFVSPSNEENEAEKEIDENILTAFIGDPLSMSVSVDDKEKKDAQLKATASGAKTGSQKVDITKNEDGTFDVYFNPTIPDRYSIDVLLDEDPVPNSPFIIDYLTPIDPSKCHIFGLQNVPALPQVNEPICFGVDAKDAGDSKLSVTSDGPSQEDHPSLLEVRENDKGDPGIYDITYIPTAVGEHRVHMLWADSKIPGSPLVFDVCDIRKMPRYPYGKPVSMDINFDSTKAGDFDAYAIHEESGTKSKVKVSKEKKGKFKLGFQPKQPGIYAIHVLKKKKEVPGSPFRIRYLEPPNPLGVVVSNFSGSGCVDYPITFTINAEQAGTGELGVRVEGPSDIKDSDLTYAPSLESKEVSYDVSYIPRNPGDHHFHIIWAGKPIPSSPLKADVTEIKPEIKTVLHCEATNVVEVSQPVSARVINCGPSVKSESINAHCEGEKSGKTDIPVEKDGEDFLIQFIPEVADDYTLKINLENAKTEGTVFEIKAIEKDVLSPDYVHPEEAQPSDVLAGKPVNVIYKAPDLEDPSNLEVSVEGPYGSCPPTIVSDSAGGVGIGFLPPFSGDYLVRAEKDSSTVPSIVPCKIRAGGKEPDSSKVGIMDSDRAIFEGPIPFGKPARFRISTVDAGPGTLNITSKGPGKAKVKVFDNKDGTYTCDFTPSIAGKYHIDILWNDQHISGSPYMLEFKSKKNRVIAGLNLEEEDFRIDIPHRFKLHCGGVGEGVLEISTNPPSAAAVRLSPLATGKNSYQCEITPKEPGNHEIRVQYNGKHVFGSPFNVQFELRGDASKCRMIESLISGQDTDSENVGFLISTEGAGRGKLTSSVEKTSSKEQLPAIVTPLPDDKYKVEFHPNEDEEYLLTVKYDDQHIIGSPFKLVFGGDSADASQCSTEGEGIQVCVVNKEARFVVNTLKANDGELSVSIAGEKGTVVTPKLSSIGSTRTEVSYVTEEVGKYDISVKWASEDIANSPFKMESFNPSDPSLRMVENPPSEIFLGSPLEFTIKVLVGSPTDGSLAVTAQSSNNKSIGGSIKESEDGSSYTCTFDSLPDADKYTIHARWEGVHIKNSPFKVRVVNPPKPENVRAYGPGLEDGFIGQEGNFTVETGAGGSGTMAVRVHGPKGAFKINMRRHPDNDRTILVRYDPTHTGKYSIDITWSEVHIPGSPFEVEFKHQ